MDIQYLKGDATKPVGEGQKYIIHVCNNIGGWGSGFVVALSRRWAEPEHEYRKWYREWTDRGQCSPFELGQVQVVRVAPETHVINMIAQHGVVGLGNPHPLKYDALEDCLRRVKLLAVVNKASIHGPRFGAGLAGGDWNRIEDMIKRVLDPLPVTIYDL